MDTMTNVAVVVSHIISPGAYLFEKYLNIDSIDFIGSKDAINLRVTTRNMGSTNPLRGIAINTLMCT